MSAEFEEIGQDPDKVSDPRRVEQAVVYKGDRPAATLKRGASGVEFRYLPEYLLDPGPDVATSLSVNDQPIVSPGGAIPAFFAGLLPEGRRLTALREAVKTSLDDELSLLLAIGADPIGDVRIVPVGQRPTIPEPLLRWSSDSRVSFRELLDAHGIIDPRGMAGFQDKISAAMITFPAARSGRDAIVKLTPPEYPHLVENEAWFLTLARRAGFLVPDFSVIKDQSGELGLLIERFDRVNDQAEAFRLPVEDGGQVLDLYPADKYRISAEELSTGLIDQCRSKATAAREIFRRFVFAWLTGNGDLHAKNASIYLPESEWKIAPIYDVPCTLPYGDQTMALPLSGSTGDLSRRAFLEFADHINLPQAAAERALDELLIATEPVLKLFGEVEEPFARSRGKESFDQLFYRRRLLTRT
jgi:serine/threonine-protein kinase HipA